MAKPKDNELNLIRVFDAPVKTVWEAWTDPDKVGKWWGPRGFTITTHSKDLRTGGGWHYTMHGPDGKEWINKTKYLEVDKYKRMVYDHGGNDEQAPLFRVTVLFSETNGKTTMDMTMAFASPEAARESAKFIKQASGHSTWDRLAEYLIEEKTGEDKFIINRSFDTDIETMYEMWSNPKHLAKWMGPAGSEMEFLKADLRAGGESLYVMEMGNLTMYGCAKYKEFKRPTRIVYSQQFCDKDGHISRHPLAPIWPESMLTTITFAEEGPGRTRVTIMWEVDGNASKEEREAFHAAKAGMTGGWTGSLDKLEDYLVKS